MTNIRVVLPSSVLEEGEWVSLKTELIREVQEWCEANIQHKWKMILTNGSFSNNMVVKSDGTILNYDIDISIIEPALIFEDDIDAVMFKMRWL